MDVLIGGSSKCTRAGGQVAPTWSPSHRTWGRRNQHEGVQAGVFRVQSQEGQQRVFSRHVEGAAEVARAVLHGYCASKGTLGSWSSRLGHCDWGCSAHARARVTSVCFEFFSFFTMSCFPKTRKINASNMPRKLSSQKVLVRLCAPCAVECQHLKNCACSSDCCRASSDWCSPQMIGLHLAGPASWSVLRLDMKM